MVITIIDISSYKWASLLDFPGKC